MSARDAFHNLVKSALQKEGWIITHDPFHLRMGLVNMYIDLGAEKIIAAEKEGQKIAVEIKSFSGTSAISDFHNALGQFINYRYALAEKDVERKLFLAVPLETYESFFVLPFIQSVIQKSQLNLIIYDVDKEEVAQWQM